MYVCAYVCAHEHTLCVMMKFSLVLPWQIDHLGHLRGCTVSRCSPMGQAYQPNIAPAVKSNYNGDSGVPTVQGHVECCRAVLLLPLAVQNLP